MYIASLQCKRYHNSGENFEETTMHACEGSYVNGWTMCLTDPGLEWLVQKYGIAYVEQITPEIVTFRIKNNLIKLSLDESYEFIIDGVKFLLQVMQIQTQEEFSQR